MQQHLVCVKEKYSSVDRLSVVFFFSLSLAEFVAFWFTWSRVINFLTGNVHIFQTFENNRWLNLYLATESSKNNCHPVACPANFYISLPTERNSLCFRKPPHGCLIHPKRFWLCQTHVNLNKLRHLKHRIIQILCNVHERTKGPAIVGSGENFPSQ